LFVIVSCTTLLIFKVAPFIFGFPRDSVFSLFDRPLPLSLQFTSFWGGVWVCLVFWLGGLGGGFFFFLVGGGCVCCLWFLVVFGGVGLGFFCVGGVFWVFLGGVWWFFGGGWGVFGVWGFSTILIEILGSLWTPLFPIPPFSHCVPLSLVFPFLLLILGFSYLDTPPPQRFPSLPSFAAPSRFLKVLVEFVPSSAPACICFYCFFS